MPKMLRVVAHELAPVICPGLALQIDGNDKTLRGILRSKVFHPSPYSGLIFIILEGKAFLQLIERV
jgi:hypothetical protein